MLLVLAISCTDTKKVTYFNGVWRVSHQQTLDLFLVLYAEEHGDGPAVASDHDRSPLAGLEVVVLNFALTSATDAIFILIRSLVRGSCRASP